MLCCAALPCAVLNYAALCFDAVIALLHLLR
jgi:hypothetical protein